MPQKKKSTLPERNLALQGGVNSYHIADVNVKWEM